MLINFQLIDFVFVNYKIEVIQKTETREREFPLYGNKIFSDSAIVYVLDKKILKVSFCGG